VHQHHGGQRAGGTGRPRDPHRQVAAVAGADALQVGARHRLGPYVRAHLAHALPAALAVVVGLAPQQQLAGVLVAVGAHQHHRIGTAAAPALQAVDAAGQGGVGARLRGLERLVEPDGLLRIGADAHAQQPAALPVAQQAAAEVEAGRGHQRLARCTLGEVEGCHHRFAGGTRHVAHVQRLVLAHPQRAVGQLVLVGLRQPLPTARRAVARRRVRVQRLAALFAAQRGARLPGRGEPPALHVAGHALDVQRARARAAGVEPHRRDVRQFAAGKVHLADDDLLAARPAAVFGRRGHVQQAVVPGQRGHPVRAGDERPAARLDQVPELAAVVAHRVQPGRLAVGLAQARLQVGDAEDQAFVVHPVEVRHVRVREQHRARGLEVAALQVHHEHADAAVAARHAQCHALAAGRQQHLVHAGRLEEGLGRQWGGGCRRGGGGVGRCGGGGERASEGGGRQPHGNGCAGLHGACFSLVGRWGMACRR
jgi:hypothetical protein